MAVRGANISFEIRQLVIFHHSKGKSYSQISKLLNVKRCTVQKIVERFEKQSRNDYLNTNVGRPRKLNERDKPLVLRKLKLNPKLSAGAHLVSLPPYNTVAFLQEDDEIYI